MLVDVAGVDVAGVVVAVVVWSAYHVRTVNLRNEEWIHWKEEHQKTRTSKKMWGVDALGRSRSPMNCVRFRSHRCCYCGKEFYHS